MALRIRATKDKITALPMAYSVLVTCDKPDSYGLFLGLAILDPFLLGLRLFTIFI
jgi:hypothetical protein